MNKSLRFSLDVLAFVLPFVLIAGVLLVVLMALGKADFRLRNRADEFPHARRVVGVADLAHDLGGR